MIIDGAFDHLVCFINYLVNEEEKDIASFLSTTVNIDLYGNGNGNGNGNGTVYNSGMATRNCTDFSDCYNKDKDNTLCSISLYVSINKYHHDL